MPRNSSRHQSRKHGRVSGLLDGRAFQRDPLLFLRHLDSDREVLQFRAGPARFTVLRGPRLVEQVLVRDRASFGEGKWTRRGRWLLGDCLITREGAEHRERRSALQPMFSRGRLEAKAPELCRRIDRWAAARTPGPISCLHTEMAEIASLATCWALFDRDLGECGVSARAVARDIGTLVDSLPRHWIFGRRAVIARGRLRRVARALLSEGDPPNPFAEALREQGLSQAAIEREVIAFLLAGIDTTPRTLTRLWYQLSTEPALERRLHQEIDQRSTEGAEPEAARSSMFVQCLLQETERLFPAVRFIDRRPLHDIEIDGVTLRKNSNVLLSPLFGHRDPEVFDDSDSFRPERWMSDVEPPRAGYFPFGMGVHRCIGEWLARITMPTLVGALARRWRIACDEPSNPPNQEFTRFSANLQPR